MFASSCDVDAVARARRQVAHRVQLHARRDLAALLVAVLARPSPADGLTITTPVRAVDQQQVVGLDDLGDVLERRRPRGSRARAR